MLITYIQNARHRAHYELLESGRFFGSIPDCQGAWGEGATLEEWILSRVRHGLTVPAN